MIENQTEKTIMATMVQEENRLAFLPKYFGAYFITGEGLVFNWMRRMVSDYIGGYWNFFELSNGGFYIAPRKDNNKKFQMSTGFVTMDVTHDTAGIVVTLYAMSHLMNMECEKNLSPQEEESLERIHDHYYQLRDYAAEHPEAEAIFALID